jgi:hypothetical protein
MVTYKLTSNSAVDTPHAALCSGMENGYITCMVRLSRYKTYMKKMNRVFRKNLK